MANFDISAIILTCTHTLIKLQKNNLKSINYYIPIVSFSLLEQNWEISKFDYNELMFNRELFTVWSQSSEFYSDTDNDNSQLNIILHNIIIWKNSIKRFEYCELIVSWLLKNKKIKKFWRCAAPDASHGERGRGGARRA